MVLDKEYIPSDKEREVTSEVIDRMDSMSKIRAKSYNYFNGRSLVNYIDDSVKRWNGFIPPRDDLIQDWQSRAFYNITRNIAIQFLSQVAMTRPKSKFRATNKQGYLDVNRAHILEKAVEYIRNKQNGEWKFFLAALENYTKGTVVAYEGFRKIKRKVKEIEKYDPTTGEVSYKEKEILDYNDCWQEIIPLEDFYIGNIWQEDVQFQPDIIWKPIMNKKEATMEFKKYKNWENVKPGAYNAVVESMPYYKDKNFTQLDEKSVEIIRYYNKLKDQYRIVANGVLILDGPIPFHHKKYPFAKGINEPFAIDFFYGKSGPDKNSTSQDVLNTFLNMGIDQTYFSTYKPILTQDPDYVEEYILQPGKMFPVNSIADYHVMNEIQPPDQGFFQMFQMMKGIANEDSGMGGGAQAQTAKGGKVSARQAMLAQEKMQQAMGLSVKMLEKFDVEDTKLVAANFLQFYTIPDKNEAITGEKDIAKKFMRVMQIDDTKLSDGSHGTAILKMVKDDKSLPTQDELNTEEEMAAMQGKNVEVKAITPDYIRNMEFDVQTVGESSFMQSKSLQQAMGMEYIQTRVQMFPQQTNMEEMSRYLDDLFDQDSDKMGLKPQQGGAPNPMQQGQPQPDGGGQVGAQVAGRGQAKSLNSLLG